MDEKNKEMSRMFQSKSRIENLRDGYYNYQELILRTDHLDENKYYTLALKIAHEIDYTLDDVTELFSLGPSFWKNRFDTFWTGIYYSALLNNLPQKIITINQPALVHDLGYGLPRDKMLICNAETGPFLGFKAKGVIVNNDRTKYGLGEQSDGIIINHGAVTRNPYDHCKGPSSGLFINFGYSRDIFTAHCGLTINKGYAKFVHQSDYCTYIEKGQNAPPDKIIDGQLIYYIYMNTPDDAKKVNGMYYCQNKILESYVDSLCDSFNLLKNTPETILANSIELNRERARRYHQNDALQARHQVTRILISDLGFKPHKE